MPTPTTSPRSAQRRSVRQSRAVARADALFRRCWRRLPTRIDRRVIAAAWASLAVQIGIVGTGGAVRLTGSGLGCPTWPSCTADSFVATPEMGLHGVIEFGNRALTVVLVAVAVLMFLMVVRMRSERRDLFALSIAIGFYVPVQAIIGGITVLTKLNPYVVGLHYFASVVLVALATVLVTRVYAEPGATERAVPRRYVALAWATATSVLITVLLGILVTGSGPHAGDGGAARNGLNPALMQHIHSWPGYATVGLTVLLLIGAGFTRSQLRQRLWVSLLLLVEVAQVIVGIWQSRTGLPVILVGIHLVLAVLLVAAMTSVLTHSRSLKANS